jgi:hypothetical protein
MSIVRPCRDEDKADTRNQNDRGASDPRTEGPQVGVVPDFAGQISARKMKSETQ